MKFAVLALSLLAGAPALAQTSGHTQCVGEAVSNSAAEPLYVTIEWGAVVPDAANPLFAPQKQLVMVAVNGEGPYAGSFMHKRWPTRCGVENTSEGGVPGLIGISFFSKDFGGCGFADHDKKKAVLAISPEGEKDVEYKLTCEFVQDGAQ